MLAKLIEVVVKELKIMASYLYLNKYVDLHMGKDRVLSI